MEKKEYISIKCGQCKSTFKAGKPKSGSAVFATCPNCGHRVTLRLNPVNIKVGNQPENHGKSTVESIGMPIPVRELPNVFVIKENPIVGNLYRITCPTCGFGIVKKINMSGIQKWVCPQCGSSVSYKSIDARVKVIKEDKQKIEPVTGKVGNPEEASTESLGHGSRNIGMLEWGSIFRKKRIKLHLGTVIIGRHDEDQPSDIQIDDDFVSRRSATIDVSLEEEKGYFFKFTVHKATNPVLVNGNELAEGQSIYLAYDDVITMGKTNLTFKKSR